MCLLDGSGMISQMMRDDKDFVPEDDGDVEAVVTEDAEVESNLQ